MKIKKRREPLDFGALANDHAPTPFVDDEPLEVAPDFDLSPADEALFAPRTPPMSEAASPPSARVEPQAKPAAKAAPAVEVSPEPEPHPRTASAAPAEPKSAPTNAPASRADALPVAVPQTPEARKAEPAKPEPPRAEAPKVEPQTIAPQTIAPQTAAPRSPPAPPVAARAAASTTWRPKAEPAAADPAPASRQSASDQPTAQGTGPNPWRTARPAARPAQGSGVTVRRASTSSSLQAPVPKAAPAWPVYAGAGVVSLLWAAAPIAFALGYQAKVAPLTYEPFAMAVFGLLALGPVLLIFLASYLLRQGQAIAQEAARARALAEEMVTPAVMAAGRAGDLVQAVRDEINRAGETAKAAREALISLKAAVAAEAEALTAAAQASVEQAAALSENLGRERGQMAELAVSLEAQAAAAVESLGRQTQVVTDASDLAEAQLREAEASLTARAADLTAAAGAVADVARVAGEDLNRHAARLEAAGGGVAEQLNAVETGLVEQRAALVAATQTLRADQEVFAAEAESQTAKLAEFIGQARGAASEMGDRALAGADALRGLIAEAADQFREFSDKAKLEREAFGGSTKHSLEAVAAAAAEERAKLEAETRAAIDALVRASEETRQAAERHAEAARAQVDQLSEAAFTAGQRANQVFETRLAEARELIERSANMVEQAGDATARKLDEGANAARGTLNELQRLLGEIESRAAHLPTVARQQADEVRAAVGKSMNELLEQARRTAEETEAIDLAFQDRVRRNYDMLSETVRLMGAAASTGAPPAREPRPAPRAAPARASEPEPDSGLRPRLKLTPTATDAEFSSVFEGAMGKAPEADPSAGPDGWTWKELLSSIDEEEGEASEGRAEASLVGEIAAMGIDPAALLPRSRIEEIAELVRDGDNDARRSLVRRIAPAATRRLARRLFTDPGLKQQVRRYVATHQQMLDEAARRDRTGLELNALLGSDAGRAFLLLDAAAGDGA